MLTYILNSKRIITIKQKLINFKKTKFIDYKYLGDAQ